MKILEIIIPVLLLIWIGWILKRKNIVTDSGIATLKNIAVNVFLPVVAFNVLINGTFTKSSFVLICVEVVVLFVAFGCGFLYKPLFDENVRGYVPYAITTFEGGMFGWAMVSILVGAQNLFYIIPMDMINGIFCFTIMTAGLKMLAGTKMSMGESIKSFFMSPLIIAVILGFIGCFMQLGAAINASPFANAYNTTVGWLSQPLAPVILICIGSGLVFDKNILKKGIKLVFFRYLTMAVLCALTLFFLAEYVGLFPVLTVSILMYFFIPTSFLLPMFTNDKESVEFTSGYLSLQIMVSLAVFIVISILTQSGFFGEIVLQ
jgi:predicted permease